MKAGYIENQLDSESPDVSREPDMSKVGGGRRHTPDAVKQQNFRSLVPSWSRHPGLPTANYFLTLVPLWDTKCLLGPTAQHQPAEPNPTHLKRQVWGRDLPEELAKDFRCVRRRWSLWLSRAARPGRAGHMMWECCCPLLPSDAPDSSLTRSKWADYNHIRRMLSWTNHLRLYVPVNASCPGQL